MNPANPAIALVEAPSAPKAIGPYSHAARIGGLLYCSGQIPLDPETMQLVPGGIEEQTRQAIRNVEAVLASQGATLANVAKTTIFLAKMSDFPVVNRIYGEAMGEHKPARSTVQVAGLPLGSLIEIEVIAVV
ncbi:MAG TPA: Rid family detoxifying hydrolase [Bacteroidia bacterium]|nr:Rid family detoxifying hydrolase [Bacteroidia bacterium]